MYNTKDTAIGWAVYTVPGNARNQRLSKMPTQSDLAFESDYTMTREGTPIFGSPSLPPLSLLSVASRLLLT